jgi:hypothetical protein
LKKWDVDGTGSGSCPMMGFETGGVELHCQPVFLKVMPVSFTGLDE